VRGIQANVLPQAKLVNARSRGTKETHPLLSRKERVKETAGLFFKEDTVTQHYLFKPTRHPYQGICNGYCKGKEITCLYDYPAHERVGLSYHYKSESPGSKE